MEVKEAMSIITTVRRSIFKNKKTYDNTKNLIFCTDRKTYAEMTNALQESSGVDVIPPSAPKEESKRIAPTILGVEVRILCEEGMGWFIGDMSNV